MNSIIQFQVNEIYTCTSACDSDCHWHYRVTARTAKRMTLQEVDADGKEQGKPFLRGLSLYNGAETCSPHGHYSMAPILRADKT